MANLYVTQEVKDDINEAQETIKDNSGFEPDKVDVLENALEMYLDHLDS
jgi:hypothetical protein